jgi:hypothetical protein
LSFYKQSDESFLPLTHADPEALLFRKSLDQAICPKGEFLAIVDEEVEIVREAMVQISGWCRYPRDEAVPPVR